MKPVTADPMVLERHRDARRYSWSGGRVKGYNYWLIRDGEAVAYARVLHRRDTVHALELSDVEVKQAERGRGHVGRLLDAIQAREGMQLYSTGEYTAAGHGALFGRLPFVAGAEPAVVHRPQTFVKSWEEMTLTHP